MPSYSRHSCQWWACSAQHRVMLSLQLRAFLSSPPPARASVSSAVQSAHSHVCGQAFRKKITVKAQIYYTNCHGWSECASVSHAGLLHCGSALQPPDSEPELRRNDPIEWRSGKRSRCAAPLPLVVNIFALNFVPSPYWFFAHVALVWSLRVRQAVCRFFRTGNAALTEERLSGWFRF